MAEQADDLECATVSDDADGHFAHQAEELPDNHCIICKTHCSDTKSRVQLGAKGCVGVNNASKQRGDELVASVGDLVHKGCQRDYTNKTRITRFLEEKLADKSPQRNVKRSLRTEKSLYEPASQCLFCLKEKKWIYKKSGQKEQLGLISVATTHFQESISEVCSNRGDEWAKKVRARLEYLQDCFANDMVYHRACSNNFRSGKQISKVFVDDVELEPPAKRKLKLGTVGRPKDEARKSAFLEVASFLENNDTEQVTVIDLVQMMEDILQSDPEAQAYVVPYMKEMLIEHFGARISIAESEGKADVVTLKDTASNILRQFYSEQQKKNCETESIRLITTAAALLRNDIMNMACDKSTYPDFGTVSVDDELGFLPQSLRVFLGEIIRGRKADKKIASIGQCIVQATRPNTCIAPLQIGLAVQMHKAFASQNIVDSLYQHGFCSSYTEVKNFHLNAAAQQGLDLPEVTDGRTLQFVADNYDHNPATLDGRNTFHGMAMIAVLTPGTFATKRIPRKKISADEVAALGKVTTAKRTECGVSVMKEIVFPALYFCTPDSSRCTGNTEEILWIVSSFLGSSSPFTRSPLHPSLNLKMECVGGGDEEGCSHTPCAHDGVVVAGRCYFLSTSAAVWNSTWYEDEKQCVRFGARLASLNTPEEWEHVPRLLRLDWLTSLSVVFFGLTTSSLELPTMYRDIVQSQDSTLAYYAWYEHSVTRPGCGYMYRLITPLVTKLLNCQESWWSSSYALCECGKRRVSLRIPSMQRCTTVASKFSNTTSPPQHVTCPRNHSTHAFLACDAHSACLSANDVSFGRSRESWALPTRQSCCANMTSIPPSFRCARDEEHVPYTLVCDYRQDCLDNSDENFCVFPACDADQHFQCESKQCIASDKLCDDFVDCPDETDERRCDTGFEVYKSQDLPALVTLDGRGGFTATKLPNWTTPCPDTHFKCLSIEFCMPVYVRCNGVNDCPEKEDEEGCDDNRPCPGFYRCRGFKNTFLHPDHLCDGWPQCPQRDDERFCNLTCPAQCSCFGHSWFCRQIFRASLYPLIRFLDAESSGMKPSHLTHNTFLIHLSLSNCGVVDFTLGTLSNLHSLDLEANRIRVITESNIKGLPYLHTLFLSGNPLTSVFAAQNEDTVGFPRLARLDLSDVKITSFNSSLLIAFPNLKTLNLSGCGIESISRAAFESVPKLRVLDMRGCSLVSVSTGLLKPLTKLRAVRADNFKVCCPATLPESYHSSECESPEDEIASCDDLFKSNTHRVSWHVTTSMALVCNMAVLLKRLNGRPRPSITREKYAVDVFVTGLFICGCGHAVYMAIIGLADVSYRGRYMEQDTGWRHGPFCAAAGFLWLFSWEVSLFLVGLITLDRVQISWWPRAPLRLSVKSAVASVFVVMVESVVIASVPLFSSLSHGKLFQNTALCSPLLLDGQTLCGGHYLSGVFSVLNVTASWFLGFGQLSVYVCLCRKKFAFVLSPNQTKELSTSRRVMAVVLCDVIYCLLIGHSSHLVAAGMAVPDNVVVLAQVLVIPFSWTLKPLLHALGVVLEHRRRDREERILKILIAKRHN